MLEKIRICTYLLSGRAGRENIWPEVMAYGPSAARSVRHERGPNFSRPARPNSVKKHFIIWPPRFSFFSFFFFFFFFNFRVIKFVMFTYVALFDRKVGIYIATGISRGLLIKSPYEDRTRS